MGLADSTTQNTSWPHRRLTRRSVLRLGSISAAAMSIVAACSSPAASPTAAPAAAPTAPAAPKPTAAATSAPPAATAAPAATSAPAAAGATPVPPTVAPVAVATFTKANINGKLSVVQSRDFYPGHNAFIEAQIRAFAAAQDYPLDH